MIRATGSGRALINHSSQIDWNKVAHNPILAQEITNGHAARMRYSRFRAAMLGLEPQRRNRANNSSNNKNRVSKKKKDDSPKPKREDDESVKSSGSGIGNIKTENTTGATIKSERKRSSQERAQSSQPPAPMATPAVLKAEPGLTNPLSQRHNHLHHDSLLSNASPSLKQEQLIANAANNNNTNPLPEHSTFGIVASTPKTSPSLSSMPYMDSNQHRVQMRLLTPCSDSEGTIASIQGFVPHSPPPAELLHHNQHHHHMIGAGSPPLSASAPQTYDFSQQQCCDTSAGSLSGSTPSPWHSQHHYHRYHNPNQGHSQSQSQTQAQPMFSPPATGFDLGIGLGLATGPYSLDTVFHNTNNNHNDPFCGGDHHGHQHQHQLHHIPHSHDEDGRHVMDDPLGLHGVGGATSMFREREMELELSGGLSNDTAAAAAGAAGTGRQIKGEWDGDKGFDV